MLAGCIAIVTGKSCLHVRMGKLGQMGVAAGHLDVGMADHLAGHFEIAASHEDAGTEGVPEVMEVEVAKGCFSTYPFPSVFDACDRLPLPVAENRKRYVPVYPPFCKAGL